MDTIIAAIISGTGAIIVCIINSRYQANATRKLIEYKIDELTKRVDKHNNVVERVYKLEQCGAVISEKIDVANHRIADLEQAQSK
jgi:hypothetical protein